MNDTTYSVEYTQLMMNASYCSLLGLVISIIASANIAGKFCESVLFYVFIMDLAHTTAKLWWMKKK